MKKVTLIILVAFIFGFIIEAKAQVTTGCAKEVLYALQSLKQVPKARKMMEEDCFPNSATNADVWLVRANVFAQLYDYEIDRKKNDSKYVIKFPDALLIANESFYKAIELKPDIKGESSLIDPKDGQLLTAYPISEMASKAMEKKNYAEAIKYLNIVIRSYKADPKNYALYLAYAYLDLANCYRLQNDEATYKKTLLDATRLNAPVSDIYLSLYDIYKQDKDTVKCGEILTQARKVIPDSLALDVKGYELDFFAMIGQTEKLKSAALKMYDQYKTNPAVLNIVAGHLINNKEYIQGEEVSRAGLAIDPDNFDLSQQMAYRYFYEAIDYDLICEAKKNERPRKFIEAEAALKKANEILEDAFIWSDKAYQLNKDDMQNNIMLRKIMARIGKPVSQELEDKVNSYIKQ